PHDHVSAAVLAARDHTLEVGVGERVVLHPDREVPLTGIEGQSLRHRPAHEHAPDLEPEVVVETACPVPLHDEPGASVTVGHLTGRLRRTFEVALLPVALQRIAACPRHARRLPGGSGGETPGTDPATAHPRSFPCRCPEEPPAPAPERFRTGIQVAPVPTPRSATTRSGSARRPSRSGT